MSLDTSYIINAIVPSNLFHLLTSQNRNSCGYQPQFPACNPYVLAVGATMVRAAAKKNAVQKAYMHDFN